MNQNFTVRDMPVEERPRERLMKYGARSVSAQELIAVVLGRGMAGLSVMQIAQDLLSRFGSLEGVVSASLEELQKVPGLGQAKALQLKACLEIARRVIREETAGETKRNKSKAVAAPRDIARLVKPFIRDWQKEHFFVVSFDNRNRILGVDLIGVGTLNANLVHQRETFNAAIRRHAASIAVCHNHPSGDPNPSEADLAVTKQISEAGKLMGIQLLDHVVISKTQLFSFRENGLMGNSKG
ncbi:MAG: DNA repair protein RadC [Candidatus Andersenbacteria bacterium]|nr:DNA repair protein RadC [bacterium]MDZ4225491.1 DNA repair protein RadC [Candidatus Andersenbacteria bacterium]